MLITLDHIGNKIELHKTPERIISLVPSLTELLFDLGLGDKIVGRTNFCVEPKGLVDKIPKVGGTKKINIELILGLKPDIIVANKEENEKEQILELQKVVPVWVSEIITIENNYDLIEKLGLIFNVIEEAKRTISNILEKKEIFLNKISHSKYYKKKVLYFIWRKPYMVAGERTFINSMLQLCSLYNLAKEIPNSSRYPIVMVENLSYVSADLVLLSTEPYPFKEKHIQEFRELFPSSEIIIVRGDYFSWYGSRILKAFDYFTTLFGLQ